ncbi:hypothetical protein KR018_007268, partial [Drosophila ironensis]
MSMPTHAASEVEAEADRLLESPSTTRTTYTAYASATLRSTTSGQSSQTNSTTVCESPGNAEDSYTDNEEEEEDYGHDECCLRVSGDLEDAGGLRYSFKGLPPELYSPKEDFIYKGPLVDRQHVLKKTCVWWFYNKCSQKMSTHWRQHACFSACIFVFFLAMLVLFLHGIPSAHKPARLELPQSTVRPTNASAQPLTPSPPATDHPRHRDNDTSTADIGEPDGFEDLSDEDAVAFVTPIKVYNYSLSVDDLIYESKRNSDLNSFLKDPSTAFSMTGTYRTGPNQIWDPHPEYNLNVFNRQLHLVLRQEAPFVDNNTIPEIRILESDTFGDESDDIEQLEQEQEQEQQQKLHYVDCHYVGHVEGDPHSKVAVSLCNGMTGYIKTSFGALLIQPVNWTSSDQVLHRVWRRSKRHARQAVSKLELGLDALEEQVLERQHAQQLLQPRRLKRRKRHYDTDMDDQLYTLEVLIAVDSSMQRFHKSDLTAYIMILLSIVSSIFEDASIGNSIRISLVNLIMLPDSSDRYNSSNEMLKHFCTFINRKGYHRDTAMLITREPICGGIPGKACHMLGLAELGTVCHPRSCSIVQDTGLPAAFTMAHELGHILSMPHDDDAQCHPYTTRHSNNKRLHIMSSVMGINMHPWSWSKCSQHFVSEFLEKSDKSCLDNTPSTYIPNQTRHLPGEIYSLDNQCQLIFGNSSRHCPTDDECQRLWCNRVGLHHADQCRSSNLPWADGTPCGYSEHWCLKGRCVPRQAGHQPKVNGGWGPWTAFTPCSLSCGGGVQESRRECDNPKPDGGKFCVGSRKKYRSCNTHACPAGTLDPREQQCTDMNGRNLNIPGVNPSIRWIPKYESDSNQCKLFCRMEMTNTYFKLKNKVTDGTSCTVDSLDKCVNGICRPAGCDNELNSMAKMDRCGVCEGRNDTCEEVTGNMYVSDLRTIDTKETLNYVTTIPKGASNIVITQTGYPEQNFIALSEDKGKNLLNMPKLKSYVLKVVYAGVTFDYNGSHEAVERVNSTYSWKLTRDLNVQIVSFGMSKVKDPTALLITYSYTIDKPTVAEAEVEIYRWEMQTWSNCDALCDGRKYRQPACVSTVQGLKVAPQFCEMFAKPKVEQRACNTECRLELNVTSTSECSAACGEQGVREKSFNCIQTYPDTRRSNIVDMSYCQLKFDIVRHEQCREGCWQLSDWTPCTKSCGAGSKQREVRCVLQESRVSDDMCNPRTKPHLSALLNYCNIEPCPTYTEIQNAEVANNWVAGEWGECSEWCEKTRSVSCANPYGVGCGSRKKPKEVRKCCHIKYTSEWSDCSVQCGEGKKRKLQRCTRVYKPDVPGTPKRRVYINDSYCVRRKVRRPNLRTTTKSCYISCKWIASDWTRCPADCSEEYQSRYVHCESSQGKSLEEGHCDAKKRPSKRRICNNCVRRQSKAISRCNCDGYEKRRDFCYDSRMSRITCPTRTRVERRRCSPPPSCRKRSASRTSLASLSSASSLTSSPASLRSHRRPTSCAELRDLHGVQKDGEYELEVRSRLVRIYCHQMTSRTPREYVTVDQQENYSIYYEYRSKLTNSCPPESRAHEYYNDQNSGRTHFAKLRLNITDLRVMDNDFEFSESRGQAQKLGSAGDCYNRNGQCPQGDFAINLEGTGFTMRPGTVWTTHGQSAVMKKISGFDDTTVSRRAFCGGYCGGCYIATNSGLYLDVL